MGTALSLVTLSWEGIHFRFSDVVGARVGSNVARYDLRRLRSIGL